MDNLQERRGVMNELQPSATLAMTAKAKAMKAAGEDMCAMTAGEPDFDTPDFIKEEAIRALTEGKTKYTPASGLPELKQAIVEKFAEDNGITVDPANVIVAPGAKFSVFSAIAALCGPGDEVILAAPYWVSYPEMVKATGAKTVVIDCVAENNYELAPDALEAAINENTKLLILNSPSNPTGAVYRKATLERIAEIAVRKNIMVLTDEIYEKLVYDVELPHVSLASFGQQIADRTITINGLSKAYSMTGWRLGYLTAPNWLIKRISALQSHTTSNPTTFVQYAAIAALKDGGPDVEKMRQAFAARRDLIYQLMNAIDGITCIKPSGAFYIFCNVSSFGMPSFDFCNKLLGVYKVAVIPGLPFGAEGNIRLSYACAEETVREAVTRIGEFCQTLK